MIFRILTLKSRLKFGNYAQDTVKSVIGIGKKSYLRWAYYNLSHISFTDDILDEIDIPIEKRISKPGKNPVMGAELADEIIESYSPGFRLKMNKNQKNWDMLRLAKIRRESGASRRQLHMINHGHQ